ncbi:MAG TPA: DNA-3-methyladenine glycosylase [Candidatus Thermoplasmatota archaeon]|nr:DNA-3-methyladenine glycosylase [Candidatus Thermoplasmatota archaeon]
MKPRDASFFARDADVVARALLGDVLEATLPDGSTRRARIVETEAYFGPPRANAALARRRDHASAPWRRAVVAEGDAASHAFRGPTPRAGIMFGPPALAYVYIAYGMHACLNVVTGRAGDPQAVLVRAAEPLDGAPARAASGPGRLARHLGVTRRLNGHALDAPPLRVLAGEPPEAVAVSRRVGVAAAVDLPLRFADAASPAVTAFRPGGRRRKGFQPRAASREA